MMNEPVQLMDDDNRNNNHSESNLFESMYTVNNEDEEEFDVIRSMN